MTAQAALMMIPICLAIFVVAVAKIIAQLARIADQIERINTHGVHVREYPGSAFDPRAKP